MVKGVADGYWVATAGLVIFDILGCEGMKREAIIVKVRITMHENSGNFLSVGEERKVVSRPWQTAP
jgi:hypothetical protein